MSEWTHLQKSQFIAWNGDALSVRFMRPCAGALLVKQQQQSGSLSDPEFQGKSGRGGGREPDGIKSPSLIKKPFVRKVVQPPPVRPEVLAPETSR